jgi:hypothetical protein
LLERAETLWEAPTGLNLLEYKPGGEVKVSLVYDSRTIAFLKRRKVDEKIGAEDARVARLRLSLRRTDRELDQRRIGLDSRQTALNKRIDYWNARGGAPRGIYAKLKADTRAVNELLASFDRDLARARRAQSSFDDLVAAYNALVRRAGTFEVELGEAQLGGTEMELFALPGSPAKDATLAAHEFGHILGLQHIRGAGNIMNPYLVEALTRASAADLAELRRVCGL